MWRIDYDPGSRLLTIRLTQEVREAEMRELARSHAQALESTGGQRFGVLVDLRGLYPLDVGAAAVFGDMTRVAARLEGYRGRAVLVDGATVAMQQRNTTFEDGGDPTEIITVDPDEALRHARGL